MNRSQAAKPFLKSISGITSFIFLLVIQGLTVVRGQLPVDSSGGAAFMNFHYQSTVITQYHPGFSAAYSGLNSLDHKPEADVSISSTLYFGTRLWKGAQLYFNPEISGGSGFSATRGIAGFPNGEVYRVSDAAPDIYVARLYLRQLIPLSNTRIMRQDALNQLPVSEPVSYISINAGRFSILDFFDQNTYSHDPRAQFYNWALMGNAAWDYPANTRGYTYGLAAELVEDSWALRFALVTMPTLPNGSVMDFNLIRSSSSSLELEKKYKLGSRAGAIRLMGFRNKARMGNYHDALLRGISRDSIPDLDGTRAPGRIKWGFGLNLEQAISRNAGIFIRGSWNDGHNETFAFTEIDRALSLGISLNGTIWGLEQDNLGAAVIINGLSPGHRDYLKAGGYGFIIGDGGLNYAPEFIAEIYYSFLLFGKGLFISPDYQFIINPAYNHDRGPVHAFGIRVHYEI